MMAKREQSWLMKSEPDVYSIADLSRDGQVPWDGVRNYRARNFMRDEMKVGDLVLFYHSNADPPGVAGLARVATEAYPDPTQFDKRSKYHDPKAKEDAPRWFLVDVAFVERFAEVVPLPALRAQRALDTMPLLEKGQRLSVQPAEKKHVQHILEMAGAKTRL